MVKTFIEFYNEEKRFISEAFQKNPMVERYSEIASVSLKPYSSKNCPFLHPNFMYPVCQFKEKHVFFKRNLGFWQVQKVS